MRFLPIVTQVFLWKAVFSANGDESIAGYSYRDFIAYYLLTMIGRAFSSMPGLASGIALQIPLKTVGRRARFLGPTQSEHRLLPLIRRDRRQ